jgi:hypothetical protein
LYLSAVDKSINRNVQEFGATDDKGWSIQGPSDEVFPAGYAFGEGDLETFEKKKDGIVSRMSDSAPYWKRLENTTGEALEKS